MELPIDAAIYRLRYRFSPPVYVPQSMEVLKIHLEVVDECGQSISGGNTTRKCRNLTWEVLVHACLDMCSEIHGKESCLQLSSKKSTGIVYVDIPKGARSFQLHARSNMETSTLFGEFINNWSDKDHVALLPVWSSLIHREEELSTSCDSIVSLRRFNVYSSPILMEERYGESMSTHIWDASIFMSYYLQHQTLLSLDRIQTALDIGSGSGLLGLVLVHLIAPLGTVLLTEKPGNIQHLCRNMALNASHPNCIQAYPLDWGKEGDMMVIQEGYPSIDLILMSDLFYAWSAHQILLSTVSQFTTNKTAILLAHTHRSPSTTLYLGQIMENRFSCSMCHHCPWNEWTLKSLVQFGATEIFQLDKR